MDQTQALFEGGNGIGGAYAENQALKMEKEARDRADGLDSAVRGKRRKATFPRGEFMDPIHQLNHAEELAARARREKEKKKKKKQAAGAMSVPELPNFVLGQAGPSHIDV